MSTPPPSEPAGDDLDAWFVPLPRVATWEQWLAGRAGRRKLSERFNGTTPLRRAEGDPRKDAVLRQLNDGERGPRFATTAELEQTSAHARAVLATTEANALPTTEPTTPDPLAALHFARQHGLEKGFSDDYLRGLRTGEGAR